MAYVKLTELVCWCGMAFAVPEKLYTNCQNNPGDTFHCPAGHTNVFRESPADILRRERDLLMQRLAQKDDELKLQNNRLKAAKGEITKLKKRASVGLCPCCNRSFTNLNRHMTTKHPDFTKEKAEDE